MVQIAYTSAILAKEQMVDLPGQLQRDMHFLIEPCPCGSLAADGDRDGEFVDL